MMPIDTENEQVDTQAESASEIKAPDHFQPGAVCRHRSWGVGQIASRDEALGSLLIDFRSKKGHYRDWETDRKSVV